MGMTDLQFKTYLKQLIRALERAESMGTVDEVRAELAKVKQDLQDALEG